MARYDRHDVIPVVVLIVVAIAAAIIIAVWLDQSGKSAYAASEQGGHVPFTNQPVTPGDPESYAGTVGQCPFYEMAGEKGCIPPPNLQCNADWSVCTQKDESVPVSNSSVAPAASQSVKSSTCTGN